MENIIFTEEERQLINKEGWGIFYTNGSSDGSDYQVQKYDDIEAMKHLLKKCISGSEVHKKTLKFLRQESLVEYNKIIDLLFYIN